MLSDRLRNVVGTASFRLAAIYGVLFAVSALFLGAIVLWVVGAALDRQRVDRIISEVAFLRLEYEEGLEELGGEVRERMQSGSGMYYAVFGSSGAALEGNLPSASRELGWHEVSIVVRPDPTSHRIRYLVSDFGDSVRLAVGDDYGLVDEIRRGLVGTFGWIVAAFLGMGLVGGWLSSIGFLKRVDTITRTANAIIAGDVNQRIPLKGSDDDFDRLSATLNRMLDRISDLLDSLRQISSDIAHDLKTPLTRLRNRLVTAASGGETTATVEAINAAVAETDQILGSFQALLRIAQIESGSRRAGFREVDLSSLVKMVTSDFCPVAEESGKQIVADVQQSISVVGDEELLVQMLANLIENSIRHASQGSQINVALRRTSGHIEAVVADDGPGIPVEEREKVFRRLYRLERSRSTPGTGLGLSIVAAIADLHDMKIVAEDNGPGLRIRLMLGSV